MSVLVIAEHDHQSIKPVTLNVVAAAKKIGGDIHVMVAGTNCSGAAEQAAKISGVSKILKCDAPELSHRLAENMAPLIESLAGSYSHIVFPATTFGKNVSPRVAALLDTQQISDVVAVHDADTFDRTVYAGNAIATVKSSDSKKVLTVRGTAFDPIANDDGNAPIEDVASKADSGLSKFVKQELSESDRPELTAARVVVSGGRGLGSGENFALIDALADKLGAAVGASRAAVDAGYVPNDYQVGQTGKVVAPDLYIAVGISGAIQHLAGMKGAKKIVAGFSGTNFPIPCGKQQGRSREGAISRARSGSR